MYTNTAMTEKVNCWLNDETEGYTGFRAPQKLYRHPCAKRKGVYI